MRITNSMMTDLINGSISSSYDTYLNSIQKIITNKNFSKVSESPTEAIKVLKLDNQLAQLDTYQSNIDAAINEMSFTYDTLGGIYDEMTSINNLIIQVANASTTPDTAKAIAAEIKERVATIQDKLNSKYMDNYIFSGTFTGTKAFEEVEVENEEGEKEKVIKYMGSSDDAGHRRLTISEDTPFTYNITGASLFGEEKYYFKDENDEKKEVVSDFFSQMKELDDLLNADSVDLDKVREKLQVTTNGITHVTQAQGNISAQVSKLDATKNINNSTILNLTENKSGLEDVDIVKAATELANAQTAMQASYTLGTRVLNNVSLLNYI